MKGAGESERPKVLMVLDSSQTGADPCAAFFFVRHDNKHLSSDSVALSCFFEQIKQE
jgi:hypothetical protein